MARGVTTRQSSSAAAARSAARADARAISRFVPRQWYRQVAHVGGVPLQRWSRKAALNDEPSASGSSAPIHDDVHHDGEMEDANDDRSSLWSALDMNSSTFRAAKLLSNMSNAKGGLRRRPTESDRWAPEEIVKVISLFKLHQRQYKLISRLLQTKTPQQVQGFYVTYSARYNLVEVVGETVEVA